MYVCVCFSYGLGFTRAEFFTPYETSEFLDLKKNLSFAIASKMSSFFFHCNYFSIFLDSAIR